MPSGERKLRWTERDQQRKIEQQRRRRLHRPAVNGKLKKLLPAGVSYLELYEKMLAEQGGVCAICGKPPGERRFHMDHDESTLLIRGLLCYSCNTKLGFVEKYIAQIGRYLKW